MKKSQKINDIIFAILAIISSLAFLFCFIFKYNFIALQCMFFFLSLYIPVVISFIFKIKIAPFMYFIYEIFLLLHFLLGEILDFYVLLAHYDTILHFISAILLSIFGYSIIHYYLDDNYVFLQVSFAFLFSLSLEYGWEILEFAIDHFFNTNMQRFIKEGIELSGHLAIKDTIKDMIVAILGSSFIIFLSKIKPIKQLKIVLRK